LFCCGHTKYLTMRNLFFTFCLLAAFFQIGLSQNIESKNGWYLPAKGKIRVLVVFLEVDYDKSPELESYQAWPKGKLPEEAATMFDAFESENPKGKITRYFHESSFGEYQVLGDYLPEIITLKESSINGGISSNTLRTYVSNYLTEKGNIVTQNKLGFKDFDLWTNNDSKGLPKVNEADGGIDHVMLILRNFHGLMLSRGFASQGSFGKVLGSNTDTYSVFAGPDFQIMRHEFAHLVFGANNFHCGGGQHNGGGENYFIPLQGGWSTMGNYNSMFMTCNAWDRDRLDWKYPGKEFTISALDRFTGLETPTDFVTDSAADTRKLILRDFLTTGDAVRVKLPFLNPKEYQQWIWIENHQTESHNGSPFDQFQYADQDCKPSAKPGIYMYLQVDKNKKTGTRAFGGYGDYLKVIPANGFYDVFWEETQQKTYCANGFMNYPFYKKSNYFNALSGTSDIEYSVSDKNRDGKIMRGETDIKWMENRNGEYVGDLPHMGLPAHAFADDGNNRINMGTNPSTSSMVTMVSLDYDNFKGSLPNNRSIYLNGIDIKVIAQNEDGSIEIEIGFKNTKISENQRWCGDTLVLNQIVEEGPSLLLETGKKITLDRGLTPTRITDPEIFKGDSVFTSATKMKINPMVWMELEDKATLELKNASTLVIKKGAVLKLGKKSVLSLDKDSKIVVEPGASILTHKKSKIKAKPEQVVGWNFD